MRKIVKRTALALALLLLGYVVSLLSLAGEFKSIEPHFAGSCQLVPGVPGPEDIVILSDGSGAFVSSTDRHAQLAGEPHRGAIYYYDLTRPDAKPIDVTPTASPPLAPHGIGLHEPSNTLFVVNHLRSDLHGDLPGDGPAHAIEIYDVSGHTLTHRRSVTDEALLVAPNDVAPVDADRFYVTNDHGSGDKLTRKMEDYLRMKEAHVLFHDGRTFTRLPGEYRYANGIIATPDGARVYLAAPTDGTVYVFDRDPATNTLTLANELNLGTGVDNINLDPVGDLWIGAHPKLLSFILHVRDPDRPSPSQVLHLSPDGQGGFTTEEVFLSDGTDVSSCSVAARHGDRLLIGSVLSPGFLDCRMAASPPR